MGELHDRVGRRGKVKCSPHHRYSWLGSWGQNHQVLVVELDHSETFGKIFMIDGPLRKSQNVGKASGFGGHFCTLDLAGRWSLFWEWDGRDHERESRVGIFKHKKLRFVYRDIVKAGDLLLKCC